MEETTANIQSINKCKCIELTEWLISFLFNPSKFYETESLLLMERQLFNIYFKK